MCLQALSCRILTRGLQEASHAPHVEVAGKPLHLLIQRSTGRIPQGRAFRSGDELFHLALHGEIVELRGPSLIEADSIELRLAPWRLARGDFDGLPRQM